MGEILLNWGEFRQSYAQVFPERGGKIAKNLEKFAEIGRKLQEISKNARFLSLFFLPPCAFDRAKKVL